MKALEFSGVEGLDVVDLFVKLGAHSVALFGHGVVALGVQTLT